jgi:hypothetical protein
MAYQRDWPHIRLRAKGLALGTFGPPAYIGPLGMICQAILILACIILYDIHVRPIFNTLSAKRAQQYN